MVSNYSACAVSTHNQLVASQSFGALHMATISVSYPIIILQRYSRAARYIKTKVYVAGYLIKFVKLKVVMSSNQISSPVLGVFEI